MIKQINNTMSLVELAKDNYILARNSQLLNCPFRQAEYQPQGTTDLSGAAQFKRVEQRCGTWCPHFNAMNIKNDDSQDQLPTVMLTCGSSDVVHSIEEIRTLKPNTN